jgi:tetratricopeptide (TPR) repeat protein
MLIRIKLGWSRWRSLALLLPASFVVLWGCAPDGRADAQGAQAKLDLSVQMAQANKFPECVDAARQALKLQSDLAEAFSNLGYCSARMGKLDEGIRNTQVALRIKPGLQIASNNLAWMFQEKAKAGGTGATPPTKADAALAISLQHALAHRFQECIDAAGQALQLKPGMAEAYNNIGYCSASLGNWDEGIKNTQEALVIKPDFPMARNNLAWMLQEKAKAGGGRSSPNPPSTSK